MILTEEQAKDKLCYLSQGRENGRSHCRASGCMAWRWGTPSFSFRTHETLMADGRIEKVKVAGFESKYTHGYCGMAGKPIHDGPKP